MPSRVPSHRPPSIGQASRHQTYDRHARDPEAKRFYDSARWRKARRLKLSQAPLCERCRAEDRLVPATHVHHKQERRDAPELELDLDNLESLCAACHSRHHASA